MNFKKVISPLFAALLVTFSLMAGDVDRVVVRYGEDNNIRFVAEGRAGNLILRTADITEEGHAEIDYQMGSGYIRYDRANQLLTWESRIGFTLNRLSENIMKKAPYARLNIPRGAELDVDINVTSLGFGSLRFDGLNVQRFKMDVEHGDVDVRFPTENRSIVRGRAAFKLMGGDMEIFQLANLKAADIHINGGIGELMVDFGPRLHKDTQVKLDHDVGNMELAIPAGTLVYVTGTQRDLSDFGFQKAEKGWVVRQYHEKSPKLTLDMSGPVGNLKVRWTSSQTN